MIAVAGAERDAVVALAKANLPGAEDDRPVYPANLWEPYRTRRFKVGEDMYALLGIPRENKPARLMHLAQNFEFFGAPVGLFFVIDNAAWATASGRIWACSCNRSRWRRWSAAFNRCMQEAWARMRTPLAAHFALGENEMIYCGMALGYADMTKPVNTLRSDRATVDEIAVFKGFDGAANA